MGLRLGDCLVRYAASINGGLSAGYIFALLFQLGIGYFSSQAGNRYEKVYEKCGEITYH